MSKVYVMCHVYGCHKIDRKSVYFYIRLYGKLYTMLWYIKDTFVPRVQHARGRVQVFYAKSSSTKTPEYDGTAILKAVRVHTSILEDALEQDKIKNIEKFNLPCRWYHLLPLLFQVLT